LALTVPICWKVLLTSASIAKPVSLFELSC